MIATRKLERYDVLDDIHVLPSGTAHSIWLNVKGREEGGIIRLHEYKRIVKTIVRALEGLEGGKLFASIIENEVPSGDREGDIVFVVNEPYGVSGSTRKDVNIIEDVVPFKFASGDHGYFRKSDFGGVMISRLKGVNLRSPSGR